MKFSRALSLTCTSRQPLRMMKLFIFVVATIASANAVCEYKGSGYAKDDTWVDGCIDCKCVDDLSNTTICYGRCATYTGYSEGCELTTPDPTTCDCPSISCSPVPAYTECTYKGDSYQQGANWDDPDDSCIKCTCFDASNNFSYCYDPCAPYDYVPPHCYVDYSSSSCCGTYTCAPSACVYGGVGYSAGDTFDVGCWNCECNSDFSVCCTIPENCHMS